MRGQVCEVRCLRPVLRLCCGAGNRRALELAVQPRLQGFHAVCLGLELEGARARGNHAGAANGAVAVDDPSLDDAVGLGCLRRAWLRRCSGRALRLRCRIGDSARCFHLRRSRRLRRFCRGAGPRCSRRSASALLGSALLGNALRAVFGGRFRCSLRLLRLLGQLGSTIRRQGPLGLCGDGWLRDRRVPRRSGLRAGLSLRRRCRRVPRRCSLCASLHNLLRHCRRLLRRRGLRNVRAALLDIRTLGWRCLLLARLVP
mmetsp:Transcript_99190/g.286214  ORF Transcript_99190/g.286214 Transcript_99190/m.286214 type:complete len:258 (-) Transcript_99190:625-1398(-)